MNKRQKELVEKRLHEIASRHLLDPNILQNVVWGKAQGWSQNKIALNFNHNPNTISKYTRIIEREITKEEIKELLIIVGLILGAAYIFNELFKT